MSPPPLREEEENHDSWLTLSLALPSPQPPSRPLPTTEHIIDIPFVAPQPMQYPFFFVPQYPPHGQVYQMQQPTPELELLPKCEFSNPKEEQEAAAAGNKISRGIRRQRRAPFRPKNPAKPDIIPPPYPWATSKRAAVCSLQELLTRGLTTISGRVMCKVCQSQRDIEFDLEEKFEEVAKFIRENRQDMHDRAPDCWMNPVLPSCENCGRENVSKPVINKKREINWLFLLLAQMIGCCSLDHLRYFCKHTENHRTGAKDRLVYLTYLGICKQLQPDGPFDP